MLCNRSTLTLVKKFWMAKGNIYAYGKTKMKFILVNHRILDFGKFRKDFDLVSSELKSDFSELADKYGFRLEKSKLKREFHCRAVYFNKNSDAEIVLVLRKKSPPDFV
jgi:hypothetical protein